MYQDSRNNPLPFLERELQEAEEKAIQMGYLISTVKWIYTENGENMKLIDFAEQLRRRSSL